MQSLEEKKEYYKVIKGTCYTTNLAYLLLHIIYLVFCLIAKTYILMYFNIGSIIIYSLAFLLIKKGKYYLYALLCGNEFLISMSVSTILEGFEAGYFFSIIGLCIVSFFTTYFSKKKNIKNSIIWGALSFTICLGLFLYCSNSKPYYMIDSNIVRWLFSINLAVVFLFIIIYLIIFLNYTTKLENRIINESRIDRLTQIHNRYDLYNYIEQLNDKTDYALAILDIDDFKHVNDIYGHIAGDFILKEVARISNEELYDSFVSRYGGEEFVIVTKMNGNFNDSFNKLDSLRDKIANHVFKFNDININLTVTIGLAQYKDNIKIEEWINNADELLYQGKNSGKNKTVI